VIVTRYLSREVFHALIAVTVILLIAFLSQQVVRYLNYVAVGKIPTNVLLQLVSFEVPYLLALLLPLGLYMGVLLAYSRVYADNEMAILQMCGFSDFRLLRLTTVLALIVGGVVLALMLWINPLISAKRQQVMASDEATLHLIQTMIPGRFQVSPDGHHVMYVESLSRDRLTAANVFLAQAKKNPQAPEQNNWMLVLADRGYQEKDKASGEDYFITTDGYRYEGVPGQNDYKIIQFKKYAVRLPQNDAHVIHQDVESLSTLDLWSQYQKPRYAAELQWRFSIALSAFLLALLAVPLSAVRPRQGRYLMILPAVLVYIIYINLLFIARHWVEQQLAPVTVGMWWVHGLMLLCVSIALYINARRWK
jgi:lipopolysaccharide export system permease protein